MKSKPKKIWIPFFTRSEDLTHTRSVHINTLQFPYDLADLTRCIGNHNISVDTSFATIFEF